MIDLTGNRFGKLTVIQRSKFAKNNRVYWDCSCDCGSTCTVEASCLRYGLTQSCGCFFIETITRHGGNKEKLYKVWSGVRQRCNNPNVKAFRFYGGRGIKICSEWNEYAVFRRWALENGYEDGLTIDRIEPSEDYCPENCRWISQSENSKRTAVNFLSVNGETKSVQEWQRFLGTSKMTIRHWIDRHGEEYATKRIDATMNPRKYTKEELDDLGIGKDIRREMTINGETLSCSAWSKRVGMSHQTVSSWVDKHGESYAINRIQSVLRAESN